MKVHQLLGRKRADVVVISPDATIAELIDLLGEQNVGAVVVSPDGSTIDGIVSERDVVRGLRQDKDALQKPVSQFMTAKVQTCTVEQDTDGLTMLMTQSRIRHVPVVDEDAKLIGIISIGDVVKSRINDLEFEREQLTSYLGQ